VVEVLRSDWLTTGPKVGEFERAFAEAAGARDAVAVSNGTAALHAAMDAVGIGPGDEVIVPAITFVASANAVVFQGGTPVIADVDPERLLLDPRAVERRLSDRTKAIVAVDYAGHPCDYDALQALADRRGIALVADACHALGGAYRGRKVGSLARLSTFSLHAVKTITAGEGGVVTTDDAALAERMRRFRNHGISADFRTREAQGSWRYEMEELGYNYRLTDLQCALAASQLKRLEAWVARRQQIARRYDAAFEGVSGARPIPSAPDVAHGRHLYVLMLEPGLAAQRPRVFSALREAGIGANVHYLPVHLHAFYRQRFGTRPGDNPVAEAAYERLITLPLYAAMSDADAARVIEVTTEVLRRECAAGGA
jgi:perosamine synthetase